MLLASIRATLGPGISIRMVTATRSAMINSESIIGTILMAVASGSRHGYPAASGRDDLDAQGGCGDGRQGRRIQTIHPDATRQPPE